MIKYYLAIGCFLIALVIVLQPVYVSPRLKVQIYGADDHDRYIPYLLSVSTLILFVSIYSKLEQLLYLDQLFEKAYSQEWFSWLYFGVSCYIVLISVSCIYNIALLMLRCLINLLQPKYKNRKSFRLFYCVLCKKKLEPLKASHFLNEKQKVAQKIGSIKFEVWHCSHCYPQINKNNIHQRNYLAEIYYRQ